MPRKHPQTSETRAKIAAALKGNQNTLGKKYVGRHPADPEASGRRMSIAQRTWRGRPIEDPSIETILPLWNAGASLAKVAMTVMAPRNAVRRVLFEAGVDLKKARRSPEAHENMRRAAQLRRERNGSAARSREWERLLEQQGGSCAICGYVPPENARPQGRLHRDHDHATKLPRGWLCRRCNLGLGDWEDKPDLMRKAASYLDQHATKPDQTAQ
jgi:hypothetical protein